MNKLWLYRVCTLALVAVFSVIVLGLSAYSASILDEVKAAVGPQSEPITYAALGITVSTITLVSTVSMLALDLTFDSLFTSYIIFEFSWLTVLWMFWVAVGSVTIDNDQELYLQLPC
ncbi:hypothetical protein BN946_scf184989.g40 [Trametes cinnabarina]|uniref:MARVEL domain-containing protein n=1 Tax=Pycnoporus cinnabarinus TaxID=5643 RepID=A0A060S924_PYCCI|nr:hypothetical protein BN946_scf184989.g40 [Trametes cinnabarina]